MTAGDKPLVWLHGEIKTPPMDPQARLQAGFLLRRLQRGERTDPDAIVILDIFKKKTRTTPPKVLEACQRRLAAYDRLGEGD
jgi:hypothetical protein